MYSSHCWSGCCLGWISGSTAVCRIGNVILILKTLLVVEPLSVRPETFWEVWNRVARANPYPSTRTFGRWSV